MDERNRDIFERHQRGESYTFISSLYGITPTRVRQIVERSTMSTRVRLELDPETFGRLVSAAVAESRPTDWMAEVILSRALGTWNDWKPAEPYECIVSVREEKRGDKEEDE